MFGNRSLQMCSIQTVTYFFDKRYQLTELVIIICRNLFFLSNLQWINTYIASLCGGIEIIKHWTMRQLNRTDCLIQMFKKLRPHRFLIFWKLIVYALDLTLLTRLSSWKTIILSNIELFMTDCYIIT